MKDLIQWASVRQIEYIEAVEKHGSIRAAARALGVNKNSIAQSLDGLKKKAALQGHSPAHDMTRTVPDGYKVKGVSTLYNSEGVISAQWVKSSADEQAREAIQKAAFDALAEELPRVAAVKPPAVTNSSLATVYTLTDSHVGALCWHEEGGADWDLKIAEATLTGCFEKMAAASPASRVGIVAQLGDFLHQDGISAVTPTSGHLLDADGRFAKVVQVAVRVLRRVVDIALAKHERVVVLLAEGNHDISSSIWLRTMFAALYENEPRVSVIDSPLPYYVHQHGEVMLAWHHGHLKKNDQLPLLFASQFPKVWGNTVKRYAHTGHRHHTEEKEHSGMTVTQHPTLAARDAYAARGGWIADRAVTAITYHDKFGKHSTATICPEMLEAA
jgi:hypothetical protein